MRAKRCVPPDTGETDDDPQCVSLPSAHTCKEASICNELQADMANP
jgi:hypothetical protein